MLSQVGLLYSLIAGILTIALIFYSIKTKSESVFLISLMFLIISWSGIEWALWSAGHNLFTLVFEPIVPLASYFVGWSILVIYLAEKNFKRRDWVAFLLVVATIIAIASVCMDCL
jgi:hypothetical protein